MNNLDQTIGLSQASAKSLREGFRIPTRVPRDSDELLALKILAEVKDFYSSLAFP